MPATYEPIATTTLGSAASSITFSSISSAYTDLRLVAVASASQSATARIRVNSSLSGYSRTTLSGDGASATSSRLSNFSLIDLTTQSLSTTIPALITVDFFNYAGSTYKTVLATESNDQNGSGTTSRIVGLWRNTDAITAIEFGINVGTLNVGTTATLYGIKKA